MTFGVTFYNDSSTNYLFWENMMGTTLYNKIPLGRMPLWHSRRLQAALCIATFVSIGLVWMTISLLK